MLRAMTPIQLTLWQHRGLWWQFTKRQVELRHKGNHRGLDRPQVRIIYVP